MSVKVLGEVFDPKAIEAVVVPVEEIPHLDTFNSLTSVQAEPL